jgi:hypothetical protein
VSPRRCWGRSGEGIPCGFGVTERWTETVKTECQGQEPAWHIEGDQCGQDFTTEKDTIGMFSGDPQVEVTQVLSSGLPWASGILQTCPRFAPAVDSGVGSDRPSLTQGHRSRGSKSMTCKSAPEATGNWEV